MTLRKAISLTKVSRATAWRDLAELVEYQAIEPIGEGRVGQLSEAQAQAVGVARCLQTMEIPHPSRAQRSGAKR